MTSYVFLAVFLLASLVFAVGAFAVSWLLAPYSPSMIKQAPYECGVEPFGDARIPLRMSYYLYALLFVLFDIETLFLLPIFVVYKQVPLLAFIEGGIFVLILLVTLLYCWKQGLLVWEDGAGTRD